jgi:hypothetical protein
MASYRKSAADLLEMVGLSDFAQRYPFELSGGMQQRAALVRALVQDPRLLLMDEPFGALDAMTRELMNLELLRIWNQSRKTVIFITHSIAEAIFLSDRVIAMTARPGTIADVPGSRRSLRRRTTGLPAKQACASWRPFPPRPQDAPICRTAPMWVGSVVSAALGTHHWALTRQQGAPCSTPMRDKGANLVRVENV